MPAESILSLRDMGFGTVSGVCVGIFVKKGLKVSWELRVRAGELELMCLVGCCVRARRSVCASAGAPSLSSSRLD